MTDFNCPRTPNTCRVKDDDDNYNEFGGKCIYVNAKRVRNDIR